jgi:hypothetical protein
MARKNPAAVALGRLGGKKGGPARMDSMTDEEKQEFARQGGQAGSKARWEAYYAAHPEKLQARLEREARRGTQPRGRPPNAKKPKR